MKKFLLLLLVSLNCVLSNAQFNSQEFKVQLSTMTASSKQQMEQIEKQFAEQGMNIKIDVNYSYVRNELVYAFEVFSEDLYKIWNIEEAKIGGIQGMLNSLDQEDPTGETTKWFIDGMQQIGAQIVYTMTCKDLVKRGVITPSDLRNIYNNMKK